MSYYIGIIIVSAAYLSWGGLIAYAIIEWAHIIQLKEYRLDRLKDFFLSKKGHQFLRRYSTLGLVLLSIAIIGRFDIRLVLLLGLGLLYFVYTDRLLRPVWTKKVLLFIGVAGVGYAFLSTSGTVYSVLARIPYGFAWLHLLLPVLFVVLAFIFQFPTYIAKRYYIAQATKKLATCTHLKTIGITGSYGKTSTRNFLVSILATKYKVVTTPKNINTEIGVARFILAHDFSRDDIFIVEMGAYRKGEIKLIADMVKPTIGIITTIGPEHLALFGSMERIRDTKGELFAALPNNGFAITNADNPYCRQLVETYKHVNIQTFGMATLQHPSVLISAVEQQKEGIVATFNYQGVDMHIAASLFGTHHAMNIAASMLVAQQCDMEGEEIAVAVGSLIAPPHRLNRMEKSNNVVILDDTYNSNPEGFLEALEVLALQEQPQKLVITRGMLELGAKAAAEHTRIGKRIGEVADIVIIISVDNAKHLEQGIASSGHTCTVITEYDMSSVVQRYHDIIERGDVAVLLENRVPEGII